MSSIDSSHNASPPPEAASRLKAEVNKTDEGHAHVTFRGELDLATVPVAAQAVAGVEADAQTLVLDLRQLTFIDSSGLRLILTTADNWKGGPERLFVIRGSEQVQRVLELTGAAARLNLVGDPSHIKAV